MLRLDHIAIAAQSLDEGRAMVERALGVTLAPGGQHARFGTHNLLLGLEDGLYLEVIAIDPAAPPPDRHRWFDLDRFEGAAHLRNWICACDDLDAALIAAPTGSGVPVELARGDLRWRMAVPDTGVLPYDNCAPALIEWQGDAHPAARLPQSGVRLTGLHILHSQAAQMRDALAPLLNDPRVRFETAGAPALRAIFDTPDGERTLS